jgi:hypothetical protein
MIAASGKFFHSFKNKKNTKFAILFKNNIVLGYRIQEETSVNGDYFQNSILKITLKNNQT